MSLTQLGPVAFWLGLGAIAAGLFALQRLRIRHREVEVPTLLFWQEALEQAPARVLVERFRHPLAYLLAMAIAGGLWLALAGPARTKAADGARYTLLIDASAGMAAEGRLGAAVGAARELAADLPALRRTVLWCGAEPRTVLLPGEPAALLDVRLAGARAEAAPESLSRALRSLRARQTGDDGANVETAIILGDAAYGPARPGLEVLRWPLDAPGRAANGGIAGLGVAPALSGDPAKVDVLVVTHGTDASPAVVLDGGVLEAANQWSVGGRVLRSYPDVAAAGGTLRAELSGGDDGVALDDRAERVLPRLRALRVAVDPNLDERFARVLDADRGVVVAESGADVALRASAAFEPRLPGLELTSRAAQAEPILIGHGPDRDSAEVAASLVSLLGLDRLDAGALATALGVPLAVGARPAEVRTLALWSDLFDPAGADLASSRAFPALVSRGLRWLAGPSGFAAELAAGRALSVPVDLRDPAGARLASFASAPVPHVAGGWTDAAGAAQAVALLDELAAEPATATPQAELESASPGLFTLLVLVVLALLGLEWALVRTGRMP